MKQKVDINISTAISTIKYFGVDRMCYDIDIYNIFTPTAKDKDYIFCCDLLLLAAESAEIDKLNYYNEFEKKIDIKYWKRNNYLMFIENIKLNNLDHFKYMLNFVTIQTKIKPILLYCYKYNLYNISKYILVHNPYNPKLLNYNTYALLSSFHSIEILKKYTNKIFKNIYFLYNVLESRNLENIKWILDQQWIKDDTQYSYGKLMYYIMDNEICSAKLVFITNIIQLHSEFKNNIYKILKLCIKYNRIELLQFCLKVQTTRIIILKYGILWNLVRSFKKDLQLIKILIDNNLYTKHSYIDCAFYNNNINNNNGKQFVQLIQMLPLNYTTKTMNMAIQYNNINIIKYLFKNNCRYVYNKKILKNSSDEIKKYIIEKLIFKKDEEMKELNFMKNKKDLYSLGYYNCKYYVAYNIQHTIENSYFDLFNKYEYKTTLNMVKKLHSKKVKFNKHTINLAIYYKCFDIVKWLFNIKCKYCFDKTTLYNASDEIKKYIIDKLIIKKKKEIQELLNL